MRAQYVDSVSRSDIARVLVALLVLQLFPNRQYHDADAGVSLNSHEMTPKFRPSGGFCKSLLFEVTFPKVQAGPDAAERGPIKRMAPAQVLLVIPSCICLRTLRTAFRC